MTPAFAIPITRSGLNPSAATLSASTRHNSPKNSHESSSRSVSGIPRARLAFIGAVMATFLAGWARQVSRRGQGAKAVLTAPAVRPHSAAPMDPQLRASAEARLEEAARAAGIADPRPAYRERLRQLRQASQDTFDNAIRHYEKHVLPAMVDSDPLHTWIEYGRYLASLEGDGRVVTIDTV